MTDVVTTAGSVCTMHVLPVCVVHVLPVCAMHVLPVCVVHVLPVCAVHVLPVCVVHALPVCATSTAPVRAVLVRKAVLCVVDLLSYVCTVEICINIFYCTFTANFKDVSIGKVILNKI